MNYDLEKSVLERYEEGAKNHPLDKIESWLKNNPISSLTELIAFESECDRLREEETLIKDKSIDIVVSNCVLNLVKPDDKKQLFNEIYRVLKSEGKAVISDIICDRDVPLAMIKDPELWSGCISGAFREDKFIKMFENAGFKQVEILAKQSEPWQVVNGIEFRSLTVKAYKEKLLEKEEKIRQLNNGNSGCSPKSCC